MQLRLGNQNLQICDLKINEASLTDLIIKQAERDELIDVKNIVVDIVRLCVHNGEKKIKIVCVILSFFLAFISISTARLFNCL
jgi:hypothetical protein